MARAQRDMLHERFPDAFADHGAPKRPLALGIKGMILSACPDLSERDVGLALRDYTGGPTYHRACVEGATRIGLLGEPLGTVTAREEAHHRARLATLQRKWDRVDGRAARATTAVPA